MSGDPPFGRDRVDLSVCLTAYNKCNNNKWSNRIWNVVTFIYSIKLGDYIESANFNFNCLRKCCDPGHCNLNRKATEVQGKLVFMQSF